MSISADPSQPFPPPLGPPMRRRQARALGLRTFYSDTPCRMGHLSERNTHGGNCIACVKAARAAKKAAVARAIDKAKDVILARARREVLRELAAEERQREREARRQAKKAVREAESAARKKERAKATRVAKKAAKAAAVVAPGPMAPKVEEVEALLVFGGADDAAPWD